MRWLSVVVPMTLLTLPLQAAPRPAGFFAAEQYFYNSLNGRERTEDQILLMAAGSLHIVPSESFQPAIYNATREYQANAGLAATGTLDLTTTQRLRADTANLFAQWAFRETPHPTQGQPIWFPQGMGLKSIPNKYGLTYRDPEERLEVHYNFFPGKYVEREYDDTLRTLRARGSTIHYSVIKDGWYVISSTSAQGIDSYRRYHNHGGGSLGFSAFWNNARGNIFGERIAILMSASLGALLLDRPFLEPPPSSLGLKVPPGPTSPPLPSNTPTSYGEKLRVVNVAANDALKIRELPSEQSKVVGIIPPDSQGVQYEGEKNGPWLFVRFDRVIGWVLGNFVVAEPPEPTKGRKLNESEE